VLQVRLESALADVERASPLQRNLTSMLDEVCRFGAIVRKLLLLARAEAGRFMLGHESVDVADVLGSLIEDLDLAADGLSVEHMVAPKLNVSGDRELLSQAFQNLLVNAIRHNRPGGFVNVSALREGTRVVARFSNSVLRPLPSDRQRIFERFYRGSSDGNHSTESVGLGLSVVRAIVQAHGGTVDVVASAEGIATFEIRLPCN
jgi:signal transduction histidine kinase